MARATKTGGRAATTGVIPGRYAISVGKPTRGVRSGWSWDALSDHARLESGHTPSRKKPEYWDGGEIPWIGIRDATGNHGSEIRDTQQHVTQAGLDNSSARLLPEGTVCLSRTASVGYVVAMGRPMATSQDFVNWVCGPELLSDYLRYALLSEHESYLAFASGTTHQTIYFPEVKAFHILRPPLEAQQKIVDVLRSFDDLIENNRRRIEILEEMARLLYREWFVHFRFPGHEDVEMVDSELGPIPEGWEVGCVGDCLTLQRGFDLPVKARQIGGSVPVIAASGHHGFHDIAKVSGPGVTTGRSGTIGVSTLVLEDFWPLNTALWVREFKRGNSSFSYGLLQSLDLQRVAGGAAVPTLNRNHVHAISHCVPPAELALRYEANVEPFVALKFNLSQQNLLLKEARDLLLPRLVSGELDVSELDLDEVLV